MSYIDSYPHELVGYFGPVPVYRPLEDIPGFVTETGSYLLVLFGGVLLYRLLTL